MDAKYGYVIPWEYNEGDLVTYCKYCHFIVEKYKTMLVFQVKNVNNYYLVDLITYDNNMNDVSF